MTSRDVLRRLVAPLLVPSIPWAASGGFDAARPVLDEALGKANDGGWPTVDRVVRGTGPARNLAQDSGRVLTITRNVPALVALDPDGAVLERIEP